MDPNIWGPKFWFSLHSVSFTYPFYPDETDKRRYKTFFELLEFVLPCVVCRVNYSKNIKQFPIDNHLKNRKSLALWLIDLHNMVNIEKGKPTLTYEEAISVYEKIYDRKIYLEDPEPHVTNGKKLSDEEWQRKQEMKTMFGRFRRETHKYWIYFIMSMLVIILILAVYMVSRK